MGRLNTGCAGVHAYDLCTVPSGEERVPSKTTAGVQDKFSQKILRSQRFREVLEVLLPFRTPNIQRCLIVATRRPRHAIREHHARDSSPNGKHFSAAPTVECSFEHFLLFASLKIYARWVLLLFEVPLGYQSGARGECLKP